MEKTSYPKEQMHRIRYTKLTPQQIAEKLAAAFSGPDSASPLSDIFAGTSLRIVTDGGPTLDYAFRGKDWLLLSENGGGSIQAGYGALAQDGVVLLSHMIPGAQRGFNVIIDQKTNLATVFEVWFSGYEDNREVQREIHYGYVARDGEMPPAERHHITNRVEGKGYYWKQDNGIETLEFYPSVMYSNFVELTRFGGELSYCGPSDYIRLDDDRYVYSRVECEFSGTMTLYVFDVNRVEQIGVRLGFDETDALEYYMFRGNGELLGQLAQFEPFGDVGETIAIGERSVPERKGGRPVYRPLKINPILSKEEVDAAVAASRAVFAPQNAMAGNKRPISDYLVGKALTLRYDSGVAIEYRFDEIQKLRWRPEGDGTWREERYESWESAPNVVMFGHLMTGAPKHDSHTVVVDFEHALATCIHGTMGTPYMANEAAAETLFGVVEMEGLTPPKYRRHQFTDELVGRALTWNYSPGLTSMHLYSTPHSLSWIIFLENGSGGMEWSGPASYVKIRDGMYFAYWLEEACNGTLGMILINERTMHDCGVGYHCGPEGLRLSAIGAHSRNAGRFDVARFYTVRS